jgi:hypothetical protein
MKAIILSLFVFTAAACAQEFLTNPSFDSGSQSWTNIAGSSNPVQFDYNATGESPGSHAVSVTQRRNNTDSISQTYTAMAVVPGLNAAGEPYRVKARIKVEGRAFVRVTLQFFRTNAAGNKITDTKIILAEAIARPSANGAVQWMDVEGVRLVVPPTNFVAQQAEITIEVGQVYKEVLLQNSGVQPIILPTPTDKWPDFTLDSISMQRDADLDGLSDNEELTSSPASYIDKADSDGDGMSDYWEKAMGLLVMNASDATIDTDHDGFTNIQEYWAATDPRDTAGGRASHPGVTANSNATPAAKRMAIWLALAPWRKERIIGHSITTLPDDYDYYVVALANLVQLQTGTPRWPAILSVAVEGPTAMDLPNSALYARAHVQAGGIALVKWAMWNPWTLGTMGSQGTGQVDVLGLVKSSHPTYNDSANIAARAVLNGWLDQIAVELGRFLDPNYGGHPDNVVLFRPCSEMTGNWFWFGHRTIEEYSELWKYLFNYLTYNKGLNHLLWVYESAQSEHSYKNPTGNFKPVPADYYYPGDAYVDVMGHNMYDDDWVLPHDLDRLFRQYPKIYAMPQAGPSQTAGATIDNLTCLDRIEKVFPRISFYIPWNSFPSGGGQVNNAIISNTNAVALMTHTRIITRDEVQWMTGWQQFAHDNLGTLAIGPDGDADADGCANLMEYVFGRDPLSGVMENGFSILVSAGGGLQFQFPRIAGASGIMLSVEASDDLVIWETLATAEDAGAWFPVSGVNVQQQDFAGAPSLVTVTDYALTSTALKRFARLRVTPKP